MYLLRTAAGRSHFKTHRIKCKQYTTNRKEKKATQNTGKKIYAESLKNAYDFTAKYQKYN